jgi:hypothetical protein
MVLSGLVFFVSITLRVGALSMGVAEKNLPVPEWIVYLFLISFLFFGVIAGLLEFTPLGQKIEQRMNQE